MHILVTGGTGFIGEALLPALLGAGHNVTVLSRQTRRDEGNLRFVKHLDAITDATTIDVAINLAGASLAGGRWTTRYKREIVDSRLQTTDGLVALFQRLHKPPSVLLSASAIGYYGHQGEQILTESSAVADGFSHRLCSDWEQAALRAEDLGVRVCLLRFGVVLAAGGGALEELQRSFRMGVASWAGDGRQWFSWVHRCDVVRAMQFLIAHADLSGPFNVTGPAPVTAGAFAEAVAKHFRTLLRMGVPGPVMRLLLGEMAQELLLSGQRVVPARLEAAGFKFQYPDCDSALNAIHQPTGDS